MQNFSVKCEEEAQDNGLCIFHDSNYLSDEFNNTEKEERIRQRFLELINNKNSRSEPILCLGYHLPSVKIIVTFVNNVYFDATNFHGTADFSNSKFNKIANFYKCTFRGMANFSKCQFDKMANFGDVDFLKETAIFDHVLFLGVASFGRAKFRCGTNFSQTEFRCNANFSETHFYDIAIFFGAEFSKDANFVQTKFLKPILPSPCTLSAESLLGRDLFMKSTSYNDSARARAQYILEDIPHLDIQNLHSYVDFTDAKFANVAIFNAARFDIESQFIAVTFSGQTSFTNTFFSEKCTFVGVAFSNPVSFEKTEFLMECDFINCLFSNEANFIDTKFEKETRFENVLFEKPERVKIIVESLSHVSFVNTDITRVFFPAQVKWGDHDTFEVFSDRQMKEKLVDGTILDKSNIESVSSMYRSLRENYEFRLRYDEAGKFFIKEMELKRKYRVSASISPSKQRIQKWWALKHAKKNVPEIAYGVKQNSWLRSHFFSLIAIYWLVSTYGESVAKPTVIGVTILTLSTLLWLMQSNPLLQPNFNFGTLPPNFNGSNVIGLDQMWNSTQWWVSIDRSLADFLPILTIGSDVKAGIFDYIIKVVSGVLVFGLLAIALRRKFERKYTR